ncbi:hypothetical protein JCM6882_000106 [Rhodosporidiobolus microsporus]
MSSPALIASSPSGASAQQGNGTSVELDGAVQGYPAGSKDAGGDSDVVKRALFPLPKEGTATYSGPAASPFDRLPDEAILLILQAAVSIDPTHLSHLALNKRIYKLAKVCYFREWREQGGSVLGFLRRPDLRPLVQTLAYLPACDTPTVREQECAAIKQLDNLNVLKCDGYLTQDDLAASVELPLAFTDVLRSLQRLTTLDLGFERPFHLQGRPCIDQDLPTLRTLHLGDNCGNSSEILRLPCTGLRHLKLYCGAFIEGAQADYSFLAAVPWATLESLAVSFGWSGTPECPMRRLAAGLGHALQTEKSTLPLVAFSLADKDAPPRDEDLRRGLYHDSLTAIRDVLALVGQTSIRQLSLHLSGHFFRHFDLQPIFSVTVLAIQWAGQWARSSDNWDLVTSMDLYILIKTLSAFPSVVDLYLRDFSFSDIPDEERIAYPPDSTDFLARHGTLSALLLHLRSTSVLYLTWRPMYGGDSYRWARTSVTEDFSVDRYRE